MHTVSPLAPLAVRLPRRGRLIDSRSVTRALVAEAGCRRRAAVWRTAYRFQNDERAFARRLLRLKPNLWLFRCNQRRFCGDFVVVDMSSPEPERRRVWVVELKRGAPLRVGGGGAGVQFQNASRAVAEVARRTGVVAPDAAHDRLSGDGWEILEHLLGAGA